MKILLIEPFYTASHQQWADGLKAHSRHEIKLLTLAGRYWKWRMHGGAVSLAHEFQRLDFKPDLIIVSDMLDVSVFKALTETRVPISIYFHENQLTYPWSPTDKDVAKQRDNHYSFINYTSALVANKVFFNSLYHKTSFLSALPDFLKQFPDHQSLETVEQIKVKAQVLPLALDLKRFDKYHIEAKNEIPIILWNHRWEYDKNPEDFFQLLFRLADDEIDFQLVVLGESYRKMPAIFKQAKKRLSSQILHFGYAKDFATYAEWLWKADIALTTSKQDFFGGSVVEAIYCQCLPLLPNRLAYPEHLPEDLQAVLLYNDLEEAYAKLKQCLTVRMALKISKNLAAYVANYDWNVLIKDYDEQFDNIKAQNLRIQ